MGFGKTALALIGDAIINRLFVEEKYNEVQELWCFH
jgi:hypothetical protein